ncbi:MAG: methionine adenosyltransferase [Aquificae bacterium]|nr:methionine adenosyltransferase [Aquificota bacterium]
MKTIQSAESVCQGHPDKIADLISDAILDDLIQKDPYAKASIEVLITTGLVHVSGELSTDAYVDIPNIARNTLIEIGYTKPEYGFDGYSAGVITTVDEQSPEIALGIPSEGAGDTSIVVGYATDETENFMPLACNIAKNITQRLDYLRKEDILTFLRPDGKAIAVVEYENGKPVRLDSLTILVQHEPYIAEHELKEAVMEEVVKKVIDEKYITSKTNIVINPIGRFVIGGPMADTGLTGRKIIADSYGTSAASGGSAFSGKDPTKIDRSASYMARFIAKNVVASGLAKRCNVEMVYVIGMEHPISFNVYTYNEKGEYITKKIKNMFSLSPYEIIEFLDLRKPIYKKATKYGHFGIFDEELLWENLDKNFQERLKSE